MSSVTYMTSSPSRTANSTASCVWRRIVLEVPLLGVLADRAAADEDAGLDRHAGLLRDLGHRLDVDHERAAGAVRRGSASLLIGDLAAEPLHRLALARSGTGQADVGGLDAQAVHQVEDLDLDLDRRIEDRRALQAVAQRLVIEHHRVSDLEAFGAGCGPVVDQLLFARVGHPVPPACRGPTGPPPCRTRARARAALRRLSRRPCAARIVARW